MGKVICRNCGSTNTCKVVYGLLNEKIIKQIEKGQILHGGCAIQGMMQPIIVLIAILGSDLKVHRYL